MRNISYNPLFKLLIDKGMKKSELANQIGLSSSTLAKLSHHDYISMDVLVRICRGLDCQLSDIVEILPSNQRAAEKQEEYR